ncbi:MAG: polysaccharide biosynthesis tyrosine autokinase [Flavobacteriaceae bacterium]|jgi:capsular exopolysaccharide synthesis family protein|nr:polysaccharide biosynthesis tyrosine autokinase [Flavobacteriaceae bacterium]
MEKIKNYQDEETIDIKEIIFQYLSYWKWFVFSVFITVLLGSVYFEITPKQYQSEAKILLNNDADNSSSVLLGLKDLALGSSGLSNSQVTDQIEVLKSRRLMTKVVDKLGLNIQYYQKKGIVTQEVYEEEAFVFAKFTDEDSKYAVDTVKTLKIEINPNNRYICKDVLTEKEYKGTFGKPLRFPFGNIVLLRNPLAEEGSEVTIVISPIVNVVLGYINSMEIQTVSKNGSVISLALQSALPENSNKIIDLLISQYTEDIIDDRKQVGNTTITFINDRLDLISKDLGSTDENMEKFKSREKITDLVTEGQAAIQQSSRIDDNLKQYTIQLSLVDYMDKFIKTNNKSLVPSNIGLTDPSIAQTTQVYNQLVLERDNLLKSSTEENPMIKNLNERIRESNDNLQTSLRNYKTTTQIAIDNIQRQAGEMMGTISQLPVKERGFRDIVRKQQTIEALYLLLLQKREEAEITTASTPDVVKIVDKAYYPDKPVFPKKMIVLLASGLLGLIIPFGVLYVRFLMNDKVHSRKEVEEVIKNIPVTGYIPKSEENLVDIKNTGSSSAEAFRILRTNIKFLLPGDKTKPKCIFVTSTISGEGKTHITVNLAFTLALTKKKVLVLEADIRKPKVREYLGLNKGSGGITEYLSENITDISKHIVKVNYKDSEIFPQVDVFMAGSKAPNPSELLENGKFKEIVNYGLQNYDYVLVDTAPVGVVTDTLLINKSADLMLYVVRANYLPKNLLGIPHQLKEEGKFDGHKTAILINEADIHGAYSYRDGGYHSYGYEEKEKRPWYKRFLGK